jgi:uncharacterized protein
MIDLAILSWLNAQLLKMEWLFELIRLLVEKLFGLSIETRLGGSIHFFIYDVIKIFILLSVLIFAISYIQSFFPPERTRKILGKYKGITSNILAALLGTVTPFCSCSSIPLFIGFTSAGLPIGTTFSFLISSPLVDLASVILLASIFNWKIAIAYVVVGIILAVIGGTVISKLKLEKYVEQFVFNSPVLEIGGDDLNIKDRIDFAKEQVLDIVKKVWIYILIGVGIGAAISFMMGVTALSLPSMIMLSKVVKKKLLGIFIAIVTIGIIIIGYAFNAFGYLFI